MDKSIISKIIDIFNDPRNIYGEYLKVIIGSNIIGEGISFYHVRQFYLLTPFWNNTETEQAIGRVLRTFSHDQLKPEERTLDIYRLAAIPSNTTSKETNENNSIDLLMYMRSEDKDINIKKIERIMKQSSVDCYLNRMRNILKEEDGSKSCDYTVCNYDCFNVSEDIKELEKENIIYDTYNLFYADDIIFKIKDIIKDLFRIKSSYDFQELFNYLNNLDIEPVLLLRGLKDIIYKSNIFRLISDKIYGPTCSYFRFAFFQFKPFLVR
jgi:superfamily II DNA or RNA helicase